LATALGAGTESADVEKAWPVSNDMAIVSGIELA